MCDDAENCDCGEYEDRIARKDATFFKVCGHPITYNEVHAAQYGLVGVFVGAWYALDGGIDPVLVSFTALAAAVGLRVLPDDRCPTFALKTIRHEPHYFMSAYVAAFAFGYAALEVAGTL